MNNPKVIPPSMCEGTLTDPVCDKAARWLGQQIDGKAAFWLCDYHIERIGGIMIVARAIGSVVVPA
jgi:hypothetical protein